MVRSVGMDPRVNPYAPGAGTPPPELAGRAELIEETQIALDRIRAQRAARSSIFYGLRGVGKTVLLNKLRREAEAAEFAVVPVEAPEDRSLPALLVPALRAALLRLERGGGAKAKALAALRALAGFVRAMKIKYDDIEVGLDVEPDRGVADSGDLEADLKDVFRALGEAARERDTAMVVLVDELQYVAEPELAALIMACHAAAQDELPVALLGAGLPQLLGLMGKAKSYAERLFRFVHVDSLDEVAAKEALEVPAAREGVDYSPEAIAVILEQTRGYPYFLQEWGRHAWDLALQSPISEDDARRASVLALAGLDASFFRVRFDRLTPSEKLYMRAMAELGAGPHRSGDIAAALGIAVTSAAPRRSALIAKGMIYSPAHGDTAFTVPLFDGFMRRVMPKFPPL
jgi:hypothetical protein